MASSNALQQAPSNDVSVSVTNGLALLAHWSVYKKLSNISSVTVTVCTAKEQQID